MTGHKKALIQALAKRVIVSKYKELRVNVALEMCKQDVAC